MNKRASREDNMGVLFDSGLSVNIADEEDNEDYPEFRKIEDVLLFEKHKSEKGEVILLNENDTYWNIKLYIKKKYPNIPIEIINEGKGD